VARLLHRQLKAKIYYSWSRASELACFFSGSIRNHFQPSAAVALEDFRRENAVSKA
jgi:hypothetical protein